MSTHTCSCYTTQCQHIPAAVTLHNVNTYLQLLHYTMSTHTCSCDRYTVHIPAAVIHNVNTSLQQWYQTHINLSDHLSFTFTPLPGSSTLLQTPECSEYHLSVLSPVVSALSLTRLQLSGTNSLFLSVILPLSVLLNVPWKPLSFQKAFLQAHHPGIRPSVHVCVYLCMFVLYAHENMYI